MKTPNSLRTVLFAATFLMCAIGAFGQGEINFDNRANAGGISGQYPGVVLAPFYGVDPANPNVRKVGNTTNGLPTGTQTYGGSLLIGTNFTATLWARNATNVTGNAFDNNLGLIATTVMRTSTSVSTAGRVSSLITGQVVPDVAPGSDQRATFQVRVWDSRGGTITDWAQVQADPTIPRGFSDLFTVPYPLSALPNSPPNLEGLQSFQLFTVPIVLNCPTGIVSECTGGLTPVSFNVSATNLSGNPVPVICSPTSGSGFRLGVSNVVCTATDSSNLSATCSFAVTVVDTTPPQVTCSTNYVVRASDPGGTVVTYIASASDACGIASFDCSPPSGSLFPPGLTTVLCQAADVVGNSNGCTFSIIVTNRCPTANPLAVNVNQDASVNLQLTGSDPDGDALQFNITQGPAHGIVVLQTQTGAASYTPGAGYCGPDSFRFRVSDGICESAEATVSIAVRCATNQCPIANPLSLTIDQDSTSSFPLPASDSDGDPLQFVTTQPPAHGVLVVQAQTGAATYSPNRGYCGPDTFKYSANDGRCAPVEATVSINVRCTNNQPPVCIAQIACGPTLIALDGSQACTILDASASTDPETNALAFQWIIDGSAVLTGAVVTNCFDLGCHSVALEVSDGQNVSRCLTNICVVSGCEAIDECVALVENSDLGRRNKNPLISSLRAACASFDRGNLIPALNVLEAFQRKVAAQVAPSHPAEAAILNECAQAILDAVSCAAVLGNIGHPTNDSGKK